MKALSSFGVVFDVEVIKEFPGKTVFEFVFNMLKLVVTRYKCGAYYMMLPNGIRIRVAIRKWFPEWYWRT